MTLNEFKATSLAKTITSDQDEEFNIPIDISDILSICREYNKLGWNIQQQVDNILELGVEDSIKSGYVKQQSLPLIKNFLQAVAKNPYFGDAVSQADDCLNLIQQYEILHEIVYKPRYN